MTSHDVVAWVRRLTGERHAGHAGTLDPAAAGVLLVLVGQAATRLAEYLLDLEKTYVAELIFGRTTETQDWTGRVVAVAPAGKLAALAEEDVLALLPRFVGSIEQVPPMVSAVHAGGERLYRLARDGRTVERQPRRVFVYDLALLEFKPSAGGLGTGGPVDGDGPRARLRVTCSRGTYVRTLAHDLGLALGVGAHLGFLVREAVGSFRLERAWTLEELAAASARGELSSAAVPPAEAVAHLPAVTPEAAAAEHLRRGETVRYADPAAGGTVRVLSPGGELLAIATLAGGSLKPRKVLKPWNGPGRRGPSGGPGDA